MDNIYRIRKGGKSEIITLPNTFQKHEKINQIRFGTTYVPCSVTFSKLKQISIPEDIFHGLRLPFEAHSHVFVYDNTLYIAPLVGIFTAGFTDSPLQPIGARSSFFAQYLRSSQNITYTFVFGGHGINWNEGTVKGYFYTNTHWNIHEVPFPNVIYDRLPNRKTENHRALRRIKERFQSQYDIPWFNPGFFNKWSIHRQLKENPLVKKYLPETEVFTSFHQVERFLGEHQHVYLKPMNGSLGSRIYQIRYEKEEGIYYCRFYQNEQKKLHKYSSLESLMNHVFKKENLQEFIVQQGIPLLRYEQRPVDFRVHTNKNHRGTFEVGAIAGKIAGTGSMTTHAALGGEIKTIAELFPTSEQQQKVIEKLTEATLLLSEAIDQVIEGFIGEIGFDIGIDKTGKVWLFEANSKPGRAIFSHPELQEFDKKTCAFIVSYAAYLTERSIVSEDISP